MQARLCSYQTHLCSVSGPCIDGRSVPACWSCAASPIEKLCRVRALTAGRPSNSRREAWVLVTARGRQTAGGAGSARKPTRRGERARPPAPARPPIRERVRRRRAVGGPRIRSRRGATARYDSDTHPSHIDSDTGSGPGCGPGTGRPASTPGARHRQSEVGPGAGRRRCSGTGDVDGPGRGVAGPGPPARERPFDKSECRPTDDLEAQAAVPRSRQAGGAATCSPPPPSPPLRSGAGGGAVSSIRVLLVSQSGPAVPGGRLLGA